MYYVLQLKAVHNTRRGHGTAQYALLLQRKTGQRAGGGGTRVYLNNAQPLPALASRGSDLTNLSTVKAENTFNVERLSKVQASIRTTR